LRFPDPTQLAPELVSLRAKEAALSERSTPLREQRQRLIEELRDAPVVSLDTPPEQAARTRVAHLLGQDAPPSLVPTEDRLRDVSRELADLDAAIALLGNAIHAAYRKASVAAQEAMAGEYQKRAAAVAHALIQAHSANFALRQFVELFEEAGFSSGNWNQLFPSILGGHKDPHSSLAYTLREFAAAGVIKNSEIPLELQYA